MANFLSKIIINNKTYPLGNTKSSLSKNGSTGIISPISMTIKKIETKGERTYPKNMSESVSDVAFLDGKAYFSNVTKSYDAETKKISISEATFKTLHSNNKLSFIE